MVCHVTHSKPRLPMVSFEIKAHPSRIRHTARMVMRQTFTKRHRTFHNPWNWHNTCLLPILLFNHSSLGRSRGVTHLLYDCLLRGWSCLIPKFFSDHLLCGCAVPWFFCLRFLCYWRRSFVVLAGGCPFNACCDSGLTGRGCTRWHRNAYNWQKTSLKIEKKQLAADSNKVVLPTCQRIRDSVKRCLAVSGW